MPRDLTPAQLGELFDWESENAGLRLLTISHPDLLSPVRVVDDRQNVTSRGNLFVSYGFRIEPPTEEETGKIGNSTLIIDAVDRTVLIALGSISSPPTVTLELVLSSDPDDVLAGPWQYQWRVTTYDQLTIKGELLNDELLTQRFPKDDHTPSLFPGMF